ncbi:MAG: hypothetical protein GYA23_09540 [Methanomicrobiales archaeon]|nr:hypothetical protein [Methanomicrobiales archaeon]
MQCPACGYDGINEESCFCPRCRYQFQVPDDEPWPEPVVYAPVTPEPAHAETAEGFSKKEILRLKVQLLPSTLIVLVSSTILIYTAVPQLAELRVTLQGTVIQAGGIISGIAGACIALVFHSVMLWRIRRA